jgi:hypothetical protein
MDIPIARPGSFEIGGGQLSESHQQNQPHMQLTKIIPTSDFPGAFE